MQDYGLDGYSFDGLYHPPINYAAYEQERFTKDTGRVFPRGADLNDITYRAYLLWADGQLEQWYRRLHDRLREVTPDATVCTWTTNAGRYGHFLTSPRVMSSRMNLLFDCPVQEWWLDETNLGDSVVPLFGAAYVRAVTNGRTGACEPYVISRGNPQSAESFPAHELFTRCMGALANGAFTPLGGGAGSNATVSTWREIARREPWIKKTRPMPWAALLVSEQTRQFFAYGDIMARYLAHPLGVFRVAFEEHLNVTMMADWNLTAEDLTPYRALVLANAACLSDAQIDVIREFVANGGGLVATCETSLFDERGLPRKDFALADLFGVSFQGRVHAPEARCRFDTGGVIKADDTYWGDREIVAALRWGGGDIGSDVLVNDPALKALVPGGQANFRGPATRVGEPQGAARKAFIMFPDLGAEHLPAAVVSTFGKGRVVYLPIGLDAANFSYAYPYQRVLLARAIRWAAGEDLPIHVDAPMCVQATFFTQHDAQGARIVIHLFNDINSTGGHGFPPADVPLREEAIPISGIQVSFTGLDVGRIHLEPEGIDLKPVTIDNGCRVEVPPLPVHAMVVAEMKNPQGL